jgi:hypothetical protein
VLKTGFKPLDYTSAGPLEGGLNLLLSDKPFIKTYFIANLVKAMLESSWIVHYVDLDTFFTVYRRLNLLNMPNSGNLYIYNPERDTLHRHISAICSTLTKKPQLIILDSIPAFYHLLTPTTKPSEINWRLGLYLALLLQHIRSGRGAILAASLLRSKKVREEWIPSYPGGILIKIKSSAIYELREKDAHTMELRVIKHQEKSVEGKRWSLPLTFGHL